MYDTSPDMIYFEIHNKLSLEDDFPNVRLIQRIISLSPCFSYFSK
jgi:hypothetical protein